MTDRWLTRCCFRVDLGAYPKGVMRAIRHVYHRPSDELLALILNLLYHERLTVPHWRGYYANSPTSYSRAMAALAILRASGHIQLHRKGQQGKHSTVYRRTELFEATFRFRKLPKRLVVQRSALTRAALVKDRMQGTDIAAMPELRAYAALVSGVKLSLDNGGQVFQDVALRRGPAGRLYQQGVHGYQNIPREERKHHLLIDGRPTAEWDYDALHYNLLLNRCGYPCVRDVYSTVLRRLGIRKTKPRRDAIKKPCLIALNIPTVRGFCCYVGRLPEYQEHLKPLVKPKAIYEAIVACFPQLRRYICTGKHGAALQRMDGAIMDEVLETLARMGIVSLPEHDSVICPKKDQEMVKRVMIEVYQRYTGFSIRVK